MATLQIEFRNGKFASHNGVNVQQASPTHIEGNEWVGDVYDDGGFAFYATKFYGGARHQLKFRIDKNGNVKKLLKINDEKPKVLKAYKLFNWPIDGVIGLSGGFVDERVVYFRKADFQKFLDEHGITAVKCELAGGLYKLYHAQRGNQTIFEEEIQTDGRCKVMSTIVLQNEGDKNSQTTIQETVYVADASWVIKIVKKHGEIKHRILITLDNPKEIIGLPKT